MDYPNVNQTNNEQRTRAQRLYFAPAGAARRERQRLNRLRQQYGCEQCTYIPHPQILLTSVCALCGCQRPDPPSTVLYNKMRRQYKAALQLSSWIAPLSCESQWALRRLADEFQLESNTSMPHVTLIEGLYPAQTYQDERSKVALLSDIKRKMRLDPSCCRLSVKNLESLETRRDPTKRLIVAQLQFENQAMDHILRNAVNTWSALPQWPLHCALGVAENWRSAAQICSRLCSTNGGLSQFLARGESIYLDPFLVRELEAPPLEESESQARMVRSLQAGETFFPDMRGCPELPFHLRP